MGNSIYKSTEATFWLIHERVLNVVKHIVRLVEQLLQLLLQPFDRIAVPHGAGA